jgi:hypothetical protein
MPKFSTYVDVDIHEFMGECSKREIKELIDYLVQDGHINSNSIIVPSKKNSLIVRISNRIVNFVQGGNLRLKFKKIHYSIRSFTIVLVF